MRYFANGSFINSSFLCIVAYDINLKSYPKSNLCCNTKIWPEVVYVSIKIVT